MLKASASLKKVCDWPPESANPQKLLSETWQPSRYSRCDWKVNQCKVIHSLSTSTQSSTPHMAQMKTQVSWLTGVGGFLMCNVRCLNKVLSPSHEPTKKTEYDLLITAAILVGRGGRLLATTTICHHLTVCDDWSHPDTGSCLTVLIAGRKCLLCAHWHSGSLDQACVLLKASLSQVCLTYPSAHPISLSITSSSSDTVVS